MAPGFILHVSASAGDEASSRSSEENANLLSGRERSVPERTGRERSAFALLWALILQALLLLPYLVGLLLTPQGTVFGGLIYNPDDPYVYLAWMRQAADGHWLFRNLFMIGPQQGRSFHLMFLAMGMGAGGTHLPLIIVYHLARMVLGVILVLQLDAMIAWLQPDPGRRRFPLLIVTLGAGLGWTYFLLGSPIQQRWDNYGMATDLWMTETVPFQSLLLNPLFIAALCLIAACLYWLYEAERRDSWFLAAGAGVCALVLGNIHSYDILLVHPVWLATLVVFSLRRGDLPWPRWEPAKAFKRYVVFALVSSPSVLYQAWIFRSDPAFHSRALVPTPSPAIWFYLLGIGLPLLLGLRLAWRDRRMPATALFAVWGILGLVLPYIPLAFQRKLAIGLDLPFLILGAVELDRWIESRRLPVARWLVKTVVVLVLALSNLCLLASLLQMLATNQTNVFPPAYITRPEWAVMRWLRGRRQPGDTVLALPRMGNIIPSATDDAVFVGHWGETPAFEDRLRDAVRFYEQSSGSDRREFLLRNGIRYVFFGPAEKQTADRAGAVALGNGDGLKLVYEQARGQADACSLYRLEP